MSISSPRSAPSSARGGQLQQVVESPHTLIHDLDDYSLLHIFYLFRPNILEVDHEFGGTVWCLLSEDWWYSLVQVYQRWRYLILASASHLHLRLVCTAGTPVADMLAHSPPLPLIVDYDVRIRDLSAEDEEGMMLALEHRDRVQCIYLCLHVPSLQKVITAADNEFPALKYLNICPSTEHNSHLTPLSTLETPALRRLNLTHFTSPIGSPLLSTAIGLVSLSLEWIHPSPHPNNPLQQLSLLPQLETIIIKLRAPAPNRDIERQLLNIPVAIHATLPNLYLFDFAGASAFLEALLPHVSTPLLGKFRVRFSNQLHFSVPHLQHFIMTIEIPKFSRIKFIFHHEAVVLFAYSTVVHKLSDPEVTVSCRHLDWQVSSATQISKFLRPLFSEVVDLTLDYREHTLSSEWHNQVDRTQWRELFGSFSNVKTLHVQYGLVGEVSRSLISDGEPPLEVLPELRELICPSGSVDDQTFAPFVHGREVAGKPVKLIGEAGPFGPFGYYFYSPAGVVKIGPDPVTSL